MTTYTAIANTEIDPESPVTSDLMTKLRDNPLAQGEGTTGAPRIMGRALDLGFATGSNSGSVVNTNYAMLTQTGLADIDLVMFNMKASLTPASGNNQVEFRYRTSTDGGSTWSAYSTFADFLYDTAASGSIHMSHTEALDISGSVDAVEVYFRKTLGGATVDGTAQILILGGS